MVISREKKLKALLHSHYGPKRRATRWLYLGVAVCGIAILVLWGWATEMKISSIRWDNLAEKQLLEKAKRDWNQIFTETKEKETLEQKINGILSQTLPTTAAPNANMTGSPTSVTATVKMNN